MLFKKLISFFFISLIFINFSLAEKITDLRATDYVNDYTGTLTSEQKLQLSTILGNLEKQTGDQVAVFVINSMEGGNGRADYIEHFAVDLYKQLGLSTPDKQTGALFLISKNDHSMRIEVGYGLESVLTDGITKNILDNEVRPQFKNNDYYGGIKSGVEDIGTVLNGGVLPDTTPTPGGRGGGVDWFAIIFMFFVFGINIFGWLFAIMARTKSWWLGGVASFILATPIFYFLIGFSIISLTSVFALTVLGFLFDFHISKNYLYWKNKIPINVNGKDWDTGKPAWWAGGGWGPGNGSSGSGFGGFGGGGFSGGGGSSSSW